MKLNAIFRKLAVFVSNLVGKPMSFFVALLLIVLWALSGPIFSYSNRWQLVINTGTTIATLLMVFLIQNTQNRDSKATHIKLDELLRKMRGERYINIEDMPDEEIEKLHSKSRKLHEHYEAELKKRSSKRKKSSK